MGPTESSVRAAYTEATADLAHRVLGALRGAGDTAPLAAFVERHADPKTALAAVRIVGADALAPYAFGRGAPHPGDVATVRQAAGVFPAPVFAPPPPEGSTEDWVVAWRDWATARLLENHVDPVAGEAGGPEVTEPAIGPVLAAEGAWRPWAALLAQLSPLSLPGVDGPVAEAARRHPVSLARAATRALLRRDHPTAARLSRWLAVLHRDGVPLPLDPVPLVEHVALHAGGGTRLALDLAVARELLRTAPRTPG